MQVPLLDLKREYADLRDQIDAALKQVFDATNFINGNQVKELEQAIAEYCGCKFAVGVASGTDALLLSLRAIGVGPGDEVITTPFTFFATAGTIANAGGQPVFVDIDPETFNIDPTLIEAAVTKRTKAIMPVHLFGQCADLDPIMEIARKHDLKVIEDAAQAISGKYKGKMAGTVCDIGCFSFYPSKNLGAAGDGGMAVTNNAELDRALRLLKSHGGGDEYEHELIGFNSRLDTVQAALLKVKLPHLNGWSEARRANAAYYTQRFDGSDVKTPKVEDFAHHIFNQYTILLKDRDELKELLDRKQIGNKIYYPVPLHLQQCFRQLGYQQGDLPNAERCAKQALSLPIYSNLTEAEREFVADTILEFVA